MKSFHLSRNYNHTNIDDMSTKENDTDLIVIFRGNPVDAEIVRDILSDQGILANLKNQLMGSIAPWQIAAGGFQPVEVEIFARDKAQALAVIEDFNKSTPLD